MATSPGDVRALIEDGVPKISAIWDQSGVGSRGARHGQSGQYQDEDDTRVGPSLFVRRAAEPGGTRAVRVAVHRFPGERSRSSSETVAACSWRAVPPRRWNRLRA
jgi:hypothetical protein